MAGERIILDPSEVATGRTALDITDWVNQDGVDWGGADVEPYRASGAYGEQVIDHRVPNRNVTIPLMLKAVGGTAFATIRESVQAKAALFQKEGGWIKRVTASGGTFYADVQVSGLTLSGGWLQAHKDADTEAELRLECSPDFYGNEVTLADHVETSAAEITFTETGIDGDYPARVRVVVDEDQGQSQLGLFWCFRSRNYSSAATARLAYEAEALQPLDTAAKAALSGASGGTVVTHGTLASNWTPVLNLNLGGTAYLTHTGTYELLCRYRTTSGTAVSLRSVYDVGDLVFPVENDPWYHPTAGTSFFVARLGELRLDQVPTGTHRWAGQIQGRGGTAGENVSIDKVWFRALDESAGVLKAPLTVSQGLVSYSARDEFNQTAGTLTSKTAAVGGNWSGVGDTDDFNVDATDHVAYREVSTADTAPRLERLGTGTATSVVVQADLTTTAAQIIHQPGVFARYTDANNYVRAYLWFASSLRLFVAKMVAGSGTFLANNIRIVGGDQHDVWQTLRLCIDAQGRWFVWVFPQGGSETLIAFGDDPVLATGGALASGGYGIVAEKATGLSAERVKIDNFSAWVPTLDAVANPSQSAELRTEGMFREDTGGTAFGPVSWVEGDLPRLPVSGLENRTVEGMLKLSRGDFEGLPDSSIDDVSARATYRPCWLTVPGV